MKNFTSFAALAACMLSTSIYASAGKVAMVVASTDVESLSNQEKVAAQYFVKNFTDGELVSVADAANLKADTYDAVWVHVDRVGIGMGATNLPDGFGSDEFAAALASYLNEGGNIYLSKHATQLTPSIGRIPADYAPMLFGDGNGGNGTDVWTIQAIIGAMNDASLFPDADPDRVFDASQVYNHTNHAIYAGLQTVPAGYEYAAFVTSTYPMEGTVDGTQMWREDHNCMWDLNAYQYSSEGKNTTEKFESDFNCEVLGTWGHVQDYCVAGIVEFKPEGNKGTVIANGLAACEWAPREGVNAFHSNLELLTTNTLKYLASKNTTGVQTVNDAETEAKEYYTLSGVRVNAQNATAGIYIVKQGSKVSKVIAK